MCYVHMCYVHMFYVHTSCRKGMNNSLVIHQPRGLIVSQMRMSHVKHMHESSHIYKSNYVTHMNESCHTYEWVMSHIWMDRVTGVCVCDAQILASGCEHTVVVYMHPLEFSKTSNTGCLLQILGFVFRCVTVCGYCVSLCCSVLQCVAVFCNVLQCF